MKSVIKWLAIAVGAVVVLLVVAVVAIPMLVDPNDFRDELVQGVKDNTGRDLTIEGDIALSVFPWLGVDLGPMKLGNAPGFDGDTFASTKRVSVKVKLMPLLSRRLEADTVVVEGLELNLARNAEGGSNWDDLAGGKPAADGSKGSAGAAGSGSGGGSGLAGLSVGGVSVEGGKVTWRDAQSGQSAVLNNLRFTTGQVEQGKPVEVEFGVDLEAAEAGLAANLAARTTLLLDLASTKVDLAPIELDAKLVGAAVPGNEAQVRLESDGIAYDGKAHTADLKALAIKVYNLEVAADIKASKLNAEPAFNGTIKVSDFSARKLLEALAMEPPVTADPQSIGKGWFQRPAGGDDHQCRPFRYESGPR